MFWFILLLLLAGAGFYFYQKMMTIEREIRAEQEVEMAGDTMAQEPVVVEDVASETAAAVVEKKEEASAGEIEPARVEEKVLAAIAKQPGIKQTELYTIFSAENKKQLQRVLKEMADNGQLKREKEGSSYLLFPG
ncbi:MAG: hypothetical protein BA864_10815 [Desulfuromonadales bacterium C00003093]|nr:MAG: hypothetical protein BA864_10815 [Desulfuromonadales bacterium C00003093]